MTSESGCKSKGCGGGASQGLKGPQGPQEFDVQDARIKRVLGGIKWKLFVMSGKGGVGKSTVAVNIAAALLAKGMRVGLLDVDMHGPSIPRMLGLTQAGLDVDAQNRIKPLRYSDTLAVVSMDSLLKDQDRAVIWRGPMKHSTIRRFIADVAWGDLDFLVIDSPPGTGDEHMTVLKTIPDAQAVIVTTPQEVSLADVRKSLNFLQYAQANILGVVENMSGLSCPHCGGEISLFKKGGGEELARKYGLTFLGAIPLDPASVIAGDRGLPVVLAPEDTAAKRALLAAGEKILAECDSSLEALAGQGEADG